MRRLLLAVLAASAISGSALAQEFTGEGIVAQGDRDNDKALSKDEWAGMGIPYPFPEQGDTNMDGKIDIAEMNVLIAAFQNGGAPPPPPPSAAPANAAAPAPQQQ